jgi:putative transposase
VQIPKRIRLPLDAYGNAEAIFHVVFRAMPETSPFVDDLGDRVWKLLMNELTDSRIRLRAACLMPDHLHSIVSPVDRDIVKWVNGFKSYSTRVNWNRNGRPALWQPGFYDRRIRDEAEFRTAVEYVLQNPVEAELVSDVSEWPWAGVWLTD